jgi:hypothetical protein
MLLFNIKGEGALAFAAVIIKAERSLGGVTGISPLEREAQDRRLAYGQPEAETRGKLSPAKKTFLTCLG